MSDLFKVHLLNDEGVRRAHDIAESFDDLAQKLGVGGESTHNTPGAREKALVRTYLELACFYAKKAMAMQPENQK